MVKSLPIMHLVDAARTAELYTKRLTEREDDEVALVATMSASLVNNLVIDGLMEFGRAGDRFAVDHYGHTYGYSPTLTWRGFGPSHEHDPEQFQAQFAGEYIVLNQPHRPIRPFDALFGRSHIKAFRLGEQILSLGGVNCSPYGFDESVDVMVDFVSAEFTEFLDRFVEARGDLRSEGDGESITIDDEHMILVDYGRRRRSPILKSVHNDLEQEDIAEVIHSSNYVPYGKMDRTLTAHKNAGALVTVLANHPRKFLVPEHSNLTVAGHAILASANRSGWIDNMPDRFNHLKVIIIRYQDGRAVMYVGSHNYNTLSVAAGTAEVTLRTTNVDLIEEMREYIDTTLR